MKEPSMELRSKAGLQHASGPELMALVAAGDPGAFEQLMRQHNQLLYRTARSIIKDEAEAEDIVQEAYLLAYRKAASFRAEASLSTWLTRIVINEAAGRLRKLRRRADIIPIVAGADLIGGAGEEVMSEAYGTSSEMPDEAALRAEARRLIEARVDALPASLRIVFVLRAMEDMSVPETASALGIPEATVRSQFFRARGLLRAALERDFDNAAASAFSFAGERCDRIVKGVLARM
jgi:RNA polymerase sigma-70 factor (ECF subfamily)